MAQINGTTEMDIKLIEEYNSITTDNMNIFHVICGTYYSITPLYECSEEVD